MFRPIAAIFRLLQFCSKNIIYILYCEVMLRSHHRYALQSVYLVNNNPEENPEDVKHTNPLTTHPNPTEYHRQHNLLSRPPNNPLPITYP